MKIKYFLLFLILGIIINISAQVNGSIDNIDGKNILTVWGTHAERGYAHGYLLGEHIIELFEGYVLDYFCQNQAYIYTYLKNHYLNHYEVENIYYIEAENILSGISESGNSLFNSLLDREIDTYDILMINAIPDLSQAILSNEDFQLGCSSLSSWGSSTINDEMLNGSLVITRLLDWSPHPSLNTNHLIIVHHPSEENEQKWASFTFPGLIGCLSGINQNKVSSFLDVGNEIEFDQTQTFEPILLSIRSGMENQDYNMDGINNSEDIVYSVSVKNRSGASIIHVTDNFSNENAPIIIECNNESGVSVRSVEDNTIVSGNNLVATNHFRTLYDPVYCYRYNHISDSLAYNYEVNQERSWSIMANSAGTSSNLQMIQFCPNLNKIAFASATVNDPAYTQSPTQFDFDNLFDDPTSIDDNQNTVVQSIIVKPCYPNPFSMNSSSRNNNTITFNFEITENLPTKLEIYNLKGQMIKYFDGFGKGKHQVNWNPQSAGKSKTASGLYFYKVYNSTTVWCKKFVILN